MGVLAVEVRGSGGRLRAMTSSSMARLEAEDLSFVREMLDEVAFWRTDVVRPPLAVALRDPKLAIDVQDVGRRGDDGLIARVDGRPVGAVGVRWFNDEDHGDGSVDERTPERSIAVTAEHRGHGIGRCPVAAMLVQLRLQGTRQVSLSVETDNPALRSYESRGFTQRPTVEGAVTRVRNLSRRPRL